MFIYTQNTEHFQEIYTLTIIITQLGTHSKKKEEQIRGNRRDWLR